MNIMHIILCCTCLGYIGL